MILIQVFGRTRFRNIICVFLGIFFLALFSNCDNKRQACLDHETYTKFSRSAYLAHHYGEYTTAFRDFKKAIEIKPKENVTDLLYLASSAFKVNELKYAEEVLIKSITTTNCNKTYFTTFSELVQHHNTQEYKLVLSNFDSLATVYQENNELREVEIRIDKLALLDQEAREFGDTELINKTDSLNLIALREISEAHGWHPKAWIILWHQRLSYPDGEIWPYYKNLINKEIEECRINPDFWASYEDFKMMRENAKQIYGTSPRSFKDYPLLDVTIVDSLRESVGMAPFWYMNKIYDWPLPEGYPEPAMLQSN